MKFTPIDSGFLEVSSRDANTLASGDLPRYGHEKLVFHEGQHYWLARTTVNGKSVWSARKTDWVLRDGQAVSRFMND